MQVLEQRTHDLTFCVIETTWKRDSPDRFCQCPRKSRWRAGGNAEPSQSYASPRKRSI